MGLSIGLISLSLSAVLIFISNKFFTKKYIRSKNERSSHNEIATRSSGIALFTCIFLIQLCQLYIWKYFI